MPSAAEAMTESEFRQLAKAVYDRIEAQFDEVDPDDVECEVAQGALTLTLADGARWVLSQQPPVRQLWLAVASKGRAYHFDYEPGSGRWLDDKGEGVELLACLESLLAEVAHLQVKF
ncbi:MAG TPA: iron donor protein CyaY [bacterium]|nr:iron donor protein CyaY [bacterium]